MAIRESGLVDIYWNCKVVDTSTESNQISF